MSPAEQTKAFSIASVTAAVVPAALVLVAGSLKADGNLRDVLAGFEYSLSTSELDALVYVLPPYFALAALLALLLVFRERRSRVLGLVASIVVVVAALAHTVGLVRLVDRTPRDFPWEIMSALGILCFGSVLTLVIRARKAQDRRLWGMLVGAHAALLLPLSVSFIPLFRGLFLFAYATHWLGQIGLSAVALQWMRKSSRDGTTAWLPLDGLLRWLTAAMLAVLVFALPFWPSLEIVRSRYEKHETCESELAFGPLWQADPAHDPVCPNTASYAMSATVLLVSVAFALGVVLWARRGRARV
jgi:hypothetical protein